MFLEYEQSGVIGSGDLSTSLTTCVPLSGDVINTAYVEKHSRLHYPAIKPGWFRLGNNVVGNDGTDYLFSKEERIIAASPSKNNYILSQPLRALHGPVIVYHQTYNTVQEQNDLLQVAQDGYPQRTPGWNTYVEFSSRNRIHRNLTGWVTIQTLSKGVLWKVFVPGESTGFGDINTAIIMNVYKRGAAYTNTGNKADLLLYGTSGSKEWALDGDNGVLLLLPVGETPAQICCSWISGQASSEIEELAVAKNGLVKLSCPTKSPVGSITYQAFGSDVINNGTVASDNTLPVVINVPGIPDNSAVVIRYKPVNTFLICKENGVRKVVVSTAGKSVICVRSEGGAKENDYTANAPISFLSAPPGYFVATEPGYVLNTDNGVVPRGSKILTWAAPTVLFSRTSPAIIKAQVLSSNESPLTGIDVVASCGAYLQTSSPVKKTNAYGEVFFSIDRVDNSTPTSPTSGDSEVTLRIYNSGIVVDSQTVALTLGKNIESLDNIDQTKKSYMAGNLHLSLSKKERAKSGVSRRHILRVWRRLADGSPALTRSDESHTITLHCLKGMFYTGEKITGVLFSGLGNEGGQTLTINVSSNRQIADGEPLLVEYDPSPTSGEDIIYARYDVIKNNVAQEPIYRQILV